MRYLVAEELSLDLSLPTILILMVSTLAGSAISGMTGLAGGTFILAVMASLVPTEYVIPLHAAVAFISNGTRVVVFSRHVKWKIVIIFLSGMLPGALLGINIFKMLDPHLIKFAMGIFILGTVVLPLRERGSVNGYRIFVPVGFVAGLLGVFFGSVGPLIARFFLRNDISKEELVGTKAACQAAGHILKIFLFGMVIGASILPYGTTLLWLGFMVVLGVVIGKSMLSRIRERTFQVIYRAGLGIIAIRIMALEILALSG